jgi:hypothetical protein
MDGPSAYKITDLMSDIHKSTWSELRTKSSIDIYRRNLQNLVVEKIIGFMAEPSQQVTAQGSFPGFSYASASLAKTSPAYAILRGELKKIMREINVVLPMLANETTKMHLENLSDRIKKTLEPK